MFDAVLKNLPYLLGGFLTNLQLAAFALAGGFSWGPWSGWAGSPSDPGCTTRSRCT